MLPQYTSEVIARFNSKIDRSGDCHLWIGGKRGRYGRLSIKHTDYSAHRIAWEIANGPVPPGMCVCHNCPGEDNPLCVNVQHLWLGSNADNSADMVAKGRSTTGERNPARRYPDRVARGERNGTHTHPDRVARGERNGTHTHPDRVARGERCGSARITAEDVREIRRLASSGTLAQRDIAARFGIVQTMVSKIVLGKAWRHLV